MMPKKSPSTHTNQTNPTNQMPPKKSYSREFKLERCNYSKVAAKLRLIWNESLVCTLDRSTCGKRPSIGRNTMWNKPFPAPATKVTPKLKFIA